MSKPKRVFSGIQPSGNLHLGNYLGAIRRWVEGQGEKENFICVVDLHAITVLQDPQDLRLRTRELAAHLLAAGIDPGKTTLFVQSHVRAHAEGSWLLSCVTPLGWLERMTQFKDKSKKQESVLTGLLTYPVLQAADILLYDADEVPVGEDQKQHVELTRDIAQRFNSLYPENGETFTMPTTHLPTVGARVMGLDDPEKKMSKSEPGAGHAIGLLDEPAAIRKKIMRATTDSKPGVDFDDPGAGVRNLLAIYQAFTESTSDEMRARFSGMRYGDFKKTVAEAVVAGLEPIQQRYREIAPEQITEAFRLGSERAGKIAKSTLTKVKRAMGLFTFD
jgi:tryptophanyl-tRNA synthetase